MARNTENIAAIAKQVAKQIGGNPIEDVPLIPEYGIVGSGGSLYCYEYGTRAYVKIDRGQKVYLIDGEVNHINRVLIYTSCGRIVEIEIGELLYTECD